MLAGVSLLNLYGAVIAGWGEILFASFKVLPWILIPVLAVVKYGWGKGNWDIQGTPLQAVSSASLLTFWGFVGLEASTTIKDAIPLALFCGTTCVLFIHFVNTWIIMGGVFSEQGINPLNSLITQVFGSWGKVGFSLLTMTMCLGTLNSWLLASGQMISVALQSGLMHVKPPKTKSSTVFGVLLTAFMIGSTTFLNQFHHSERILGRVIELCCAIFIMIYVACLLALIRFIWRKEVQVSRWFWSIMCIAGGFSLWSLYAVPISFWIVPGILFITGALIKGRFTDRSTYSS